MNRAVAQFAKLIVRPVLLDINAWSETAERLVLGTIAQESQFKYLHQIGGGPALGLIQMEPETHDDIWENWLRYRPLWNARARRWSRVSGLPGTPRPQADEPVWNLRYAVVMCRMHYLRVPERLPSPYPHLLARYWKQHYNTSSGGGLPEEFIENYERYVA